MSELIKNLKLHEGFSAQIYRDSLGYETIGYGFKVDCLSKDELLLNGGKKEPMSKEVAEQILILKIKKLRPAVFSALKWLEAKPLCVQECVLEMAYQMGLKKLLMFKNTLKFIELGEYQKAYENGLKSLWAKQTPSRARDVLGMLLKA